MHWLANEATIIDEVVWCRLMDNQLHVMIYVCGCSKVTMERNYIYIYTDGQTIILLAYTLTKSCPLLPPLTTSGAMYSIVPQKE